MPKIERYLLNLAGEFRVCSELNKRGVFATVTYGNRKGVDVLAIDEKSGKSLKIEVKTSQRPRFVTSISQKKIAAETAPDYWVLFLLQPRAPETFVERFFVLTHKEICSVQRKRNQKYARRYKAKHGCPPDFSKGVDNVLLDDVLDFENAWNEIVNAF
ncbi:MAG: hypothetical protein IH987_14110 [Planctomycetes bacterium]|nr:hypothetical protein [Planctomycetota bacterium]